MKTVVNALPYKKTSSGIGVMIRELYDVYTRITERVYKIILSRDSPELPTGGQLVSLQ